MSTTVRAEKENPMGSRAVFPLLIAMSIPPMISMLTSSLYNIVDGIYVSAIGEEAFTAVSLVYPLQNLVLSVAEGVGVGMNSYIARAIGAGKDEEAGRTAGNAMLAILLHYVGFVLVQGLIPATAGAIWRGRVRQHLRRLTSMAQEARRLGAEAASPQKVEHLREAIGQLQPTESARIHTHDPDLKGLEDAVNDLLDRMQAAYSQQTRFVSDASHELRTPIAVLKGYADLLERWGKDDPQVRDEAISAIQTEAERMSRLVEQLLFLARGDSGRTKLTVAPVDLGDLVREVWEESHMIDPGHRWELETPAPLTVQADRDMLKQALRILTDNAAKYTPRDGEICLRTMTDETGRPCISVRDTGMGIRPEDAPHVFQRFYRADPARSRQSGGAGLGLSIAGWIIEQHGGMLEVYSWEGVGSRFTIHLPGGGA